MPTYWFCVFRGVFLYSIMSVKVAEWFRQADYDFETAEYMFAGGRYFYAVFMCHLAAEKSLKGLYATRTREVPPKTHSLIYFVNKLGLAPPANVGKFLASLSQSSVLTRYPEDLDLLRKNFTKEVVQEILTKTQETLSWIKKQS